VGKINWAKASRSKIQGGSNVEYNNKTEANLKPQGPPIRSFRDWLARFQPQQFIAFLTYLGWLWQRGKLVEVVAEGAGSVFKRYWPVLRRLANKDRIKLLVVDIKEPSAQLLEEFAETSNVSFLNKTKAKDRAVLNQLVVDIVFILVPDAYHVIEAEKWLHRTNYLFIEKPYDRSLLNSEAFQQLVDECC